MTETIEICKTPDESFALGERIGGELRRSDVVLLFGGLGAGKTLLAKGMLNALGYDIDEVTSPSFSLVNLYRTDNFDVYHIDLWRLESSKDAGAAVGLADILEHENAVTLIEWADNLAETSFQGRVIRIEIIGDGDEPRKITATWEGRKDFSDTGRVSGNSSGSNSAGTNNEPSSSMNPNTKLPATIADPRVIVRKEARVLELYDGKNLIKTYKAGLGFAPAGDKEIEGDGRTPEGEFYVFGKNEKSKFTVSLGLSYPNKEDAGRGAAAGLITEDEAAEINRAIDSRDEPPQKTKLGGEIYIHGAGSDSDWTWGCIALNDGDLLELFAIAKTGMPVTILP